MRRRFSPAVAQPVQHLAQPARLVVEPDQQAGGVVAGRARRLPPEQQEARDVDRTVVEARLGHDQVEQLGGQRGRQRARRAGRRAPSPPPPPPTAPPPRPRPRTASTRPAAQRAAATGCANTRSTPVVVPGVGQQRVRRLDDDLADDQQVRIDEMVERVRDQPLRRLLDGHDAVVGAAPHLAEHLAQAGGRAVQRRQAEPGLARQVAERRLRPRVRHHQRALQRQAGGHDLAEHRPHRLAREGAVGRRGQPLQHRTLALGDVERLAPLALAAPDLAHHLGAPVEQRQDLIVDAVDRRAQRREIV